MAVSAERVIAWYRDMGLAAEHVVDPPDKVYQPHEHHEETRLYTLAGWAGLRLEGGSWRTLEEDSEIIIAANVLHEVHAGPDGWEHIIAWNPDEAAASADVPHAW